MRVRGWLLVSLAVALALGVAYWSVRDSQEYPGALDPRNPGPDGAQAVARVLDDEGVELTVARSADALEETTVDARTTVVVTGTDGLAPSTLRRLREHAAPGRLVLVEPPYALLREIDRSLQDATVWDEELAADCRAVDGITLDGLGLEVDRASSYSREGCFGTGEDEAVLVADPDDDVVYFGAGEAVSNEQVTRADNAAVVLRLLGAEPRLVWYVPDPTDATADDAVTLGSLLPDWIGPGLWLLGLSAVALVLWRVRRLGPLSIEPLPVVVRAAETARSRGRLYRRSGDRAHAAHALRRAASTDLAARVRLDRHASPATVAEAVARHLGRPVAEIDALLTDRTPPPATDRDLVRLAEELARLRREVGHR